MLKKFRKEIAAILSGIGFAYFWQLFALLFVENRTVEDFIPIWGIQLAIAPMATWVAFALYQVKWMRQYAAITAYGMAIAIPLALVSLAGILAFPGQLETIQFWAGVLLITAIPAIPFEVEMHRWLKQRHKKA